MSPSVQVGEIVEIEIESVSSRGPGVGRHEGLVIFVPLTAPHEKIRVQIKHIHKNYAEGGLVEILSPSPFRITPKCPVAGICGGCDWQHIEYSQQLEQKRRIVSHALGRIARLEIVVPPVFPSPQIFRYRNRVQVRIAGNNLGFYKRGSNEIVPIEDCPVTEELLTQKFAQIRERFKSKTEGQTKVELFLTPKLEVKTSLDRGHGVDLGFSQINRYQNENLIKCLIERVQGSQPARILDLYCGSGNFTFPLSEIFAKTEIVGVDVNKNAIVQGQQNVKNHNLSFQAGSVEHCLLRMSPKDNTLLVLDPPREGCSEIVLREIQRLTPCRILYISCDPVTFSRDVARLSSKYTLESVQPLDMFPHTPHIEVLGDLKIKTQK